MINLFFFFFVFVSRTYFPCLYSSETVFFSQYLYLWILDPGFFPPAIINIIMVQGRFDFRRRALSAHIYIYTVRSCLWPSNFHRASSVDIFITTTNGTWYWFFFFVLNERVERHVCSCVSLNEIRHMIIVITLRSETLLPVAHARSCWNLRFIERWPQIGETEEEAEKKIAFIAII